MTKAALGFVAVALIAAAIGYFGGMSTVGGLGRVAFFLSGLFALIFLFVGRDPDHGA